MQECFAILPSVPFHRFLFSTWPFATLGLSALSSVEGEGLRWAVPRQPCRSTAASAPRSDEWFSAASVLHLVSPPDAIAKSQIEGKVVWNIFVHEYKPQSLLHIFGITTEPHILWNTFPALFCADQRRLQAVWFPWWYCWFVLFSFSRGRSTAGKEGVQQRQASLASRPGLRWRQRRYPVGGKMTPGG